MHLLKSIKSLNVRTVLVVLGLIVTASFVPVISHAQIGGAVEGFIWGIVANFFGWFVWLGGAILNHGINEYVIGFGKTYQTTGLGFTIDSLWVLVRDIFNLTFIFGLVFIGLRMIFNSGDSSTKKMLVSLVMAALLVNFSLFITKFVIDFSNIAASQLTGAFPAQTSATPGGTATPGAVDISGAFMSTMGLTGVINVSTSNGFDFTKATSGGSWGYIFGTMILFIIAAFVFLSGGILIMIRFVVLNIYMVLSPLMFIGWIFPGAAGITSTYWKGFLGQAFFAPAYLLMLYFSVRILTTFQTTGGSNTSISNVFSTGANFAQSFPPFILSSIFLIAALVVAKKVGAIGASGAVSMGQSLSGKAKGYAGAVTFGTTARAGQSIVGGSARRLTQSAKMQEWGAKNKLFLGRAAFKASNTLADSSFDARKVGGLGKTLGIGEGGKGGFDTRVKAKAEADKKFVESLGDTQVFAKDANGNLQLDAKGKPQFVSNKIAEDFERRRQEKLTNNPKYQKEAANKTKLEAEKLAIDTDLGAKRAEKVKLEEEAAELEKKVKADPYDAQSRTALEGRKEALATASTLVKNLENQSLKSNVALAAVQKEQETILKGIDASVESSIKYQNQLAFIASRAKSAAFYSRERNQLAGGAAAGGLAGVATLAGASSLGLGVGVGAIAVGAMDNIGYAKQQSVNNLQKMYGADGSNMDKTKKTKSELDGLAEQMKKLGVTTEAAASEATT